LKGCEIKNIKQSETISSVEQIQSVNFEEIKLSMFDSELDKYQKDQFKIFIRMSDNKIKTMYLPTSKLPNWIPDRDRSMCSCGASYWLFTHRHHCRGCGEVFCASCLSPQVIPYLGYNFRVSTCRGCEKKFWNQILDKVLTAIDSAKSTDDKILYFKLADFLLQRYKRSLTDDMSLKNRLMEIVNTAIKSNNLSFGIW